MEVRAKRATPLTNPIAATTYLQVDNSALAAVVFIPAGVQSFYVRATGTATGGTTVNFTPKIQFVDKAQGASGAATAGNNTDFFTGGAVAYNTASGPWSLEVFCTYDPVNKLLSGVGWGTNGSGGAAVAAAAATQITASTYADLDLSLSGFGFAVTGLFSTTNASNKCTLYTLQLDYEAGITAE